MKKKISRLLFTLIDAALLPFSLLLSPIWRFVRRYGVLNFPLHRKLFVSQKIFPITDHYYEPKFLYDDSFDTAQKRSLPLEFREQEQLALLAQLKYKEELAGLALTGEPGSGIFYMDNNSFGRGDAELYYLLIRNKKPKKIIEIGSGSSTLIALAAIRKNSEEGSPAELVCIEPYEMPWLEEINEIQLMRKQVEEIPVSFFSSLGKGDVLFIDSSHIIRPGGDVLYECLEILPNLNAGVLIHFHDIFSPRHYKKEWLKDNFCFWNEQYLLEAFLAKNDDFQIIASLNYLKNDYFEQVKETLVHLQRTDEPASFWLLKNS